jgi:putative DNA primase/helicase
MLNARDLAERLHLRRTMPSLSVNAWRGRCPVCDYPGNTFSLRERKGRLRAVCANGCAGDDIAAAMQRAMGVEWQRPDFTPPPNDDARRARNQERASMIWRGSEPPAGTPGELYLVARELPHLVCCPALRFRGDCPHPERTRLPALIAAVTDTAGAMIGIHRTFLRRDGSKAAVDPQKASIGPAWGGAIRLSAADEHLVIGEGIETAASASLLLGLPAWSAISAGNLARGLGLPPEVRFVTIAADPDSAGRDAARAAWSRWTAEGRRVRIALPDGRGDFNDMLLARAVANG